MNTTTTITPLSKQEIFDLVCEHLAQQKMRCVSNAGCCVYRGPNGLKCAIGALIPDDLFTPEMEYETISNLLLHDDATSKRLCNLFGGTSNLEFLSSLQEAHDAPAFSAQELRGRLLNIASTEDLDNAKVELITEWVS